MTDQQFYAGDHWAKDEAEATERTWEDIEKRLDRAGAIEAALREVIAAFEDPDFWDRDYCISDRFHTAIDTASEALGGPVSGGVDPKDNQSPGGGDTACS